MRSLSSLRLRPSILAGPFEHGGETGGKAPDCRDGGMRGGAPGENAGRVEAQTTPSAKFAGGPHGVAVEPVVRAAYFREVGHYQLKG